MTSPLVAELNNRGVILLGIGLHEEAMLHFVQAARSAYRNSIPPEMQAFWDTPYESQQYFNMPWEQHITQFPPVEGKLNSMETTNNCCISSLCRSKTTACFVYGRAFFIPPTSTSVEANSSVPIFNLALAYHLKGIHLPRTGALRTALQLYEVTVASLSKLRPSQSTPILATIIFNNMGQIYHELMEYEPMRACVAELTRVLDVVNPHFFLYRNEFEGMLLNFILLKEPTAAPAA